ncbi:endonuclease [Endozoicomonas sp. OPT23]|uniref:GIY-YIG nuclease family protein n=1 Tax=Endozoicomonas sp. OPT23 TaxID=2072845 RepID=UPI00129B4083|nr:GIY-YIG nuclease family protein [Endozoicomonas sp. OPT23]MRI31842.1 endonuclease [Endozoicomonas sp. OPT23]
MHKKQEIWLVYIIKACDNTLYTGITTNLRRRWRQHSGEIKGGARFFNGRKPSSLVFVETFSDRSSASVREAEIKKLSRQQKDILLLSRRNQVSDYSEVNLQSEP